MKNVFFNGSALKRGVWAKGLVIKIFFSLSLCIKKVPTAIKLERGGRVVRP